MSQTPPTLTFRVSVPSTASADTVYDLLSDLGTHLLWAGEEAPRKDFRLLTMDAPSGSATVGDRFSSSGAANQGAVFHDRSVVVEAEPGRRFGFDTEATLDRKRAKTWHARFAHRYAIEPSAEGVVISYLGEVRPQNYVPWWLKPGIRPMTRRMVQKMTGKHLRNLANLAEAARRQG